jgi:hypothetical protein
MHEIETYWSLRDLWQAHQVLDLEEDAEVIAENAMQDLSKK